jgi:hypothetical protein
MSSLPRKLALAAAGLTFAGTGIAAASALPGVDLPGSDVTEALPEVTTTLPADVTTTLVDVTTTLPGEVTTTLPVEVTTTLPEVTTTLPDVTTPTTGGAGVLPPPATSASEAAKIHAFDEACGNHGRYVSHVARFGTEPPCATGARTGTTTPTVPTGGATTDEPAATSKGGGKPAKAGSQGGSDGRGGR